MDRNNPVAYSFQATDTSEPPVTLSGFGTLNTGTLNNGQQQTYTFAAPAGLAVYLDNRDSATTSIQYTLRNPGGNIVFSLSGTTDSSPTILQHSGNYVLTVLSSANTSAYAFRMVDMIGNATALTLGSTVTATLPAANAADFYSFNGTAGQQIYLDGLSSSTSSVIANLTSPSGVVLFNAYLRNNTGPITLAEAGVYRVVVTSNAANDGPYSFQLSDVGAAPVVNAGDTISGTLAAGQSLLYRVNGTAGQRLYFDDLSATSPQDSSSVWYLYGTDNQQLASSYLVYPFTSDDMEVLLPATGSYTLVLQSGSANPVPFSFRLLNWAGNATAMALNSTVTGNFTVANQTDLYTFSGASGQRLIFDGLDSHGTALNVLINSPSGPQVFSLRADQDSATFVLPETGTYRLYVNGSSTAGSYGFRLLDTAAGTAVTLGNAVTGTLNPGNSAVIYHVTGVAGQHLYFDDQSASDPTDSSSVWSLFAPNGDRVGNNYLVYRFTNDDFEVQLPASGTYNLVLFGGTPAASVNYAFRVFDNSAPPNLTLGATTVGVLNPARSTDLYRFNGTAGQRIFFDGIDAHGVSVPATLYAPDGTQIFSVNSDQDSGPFTLNQTGEYRLVIYGNNDTSGTYGFRILDAAAAPLVTLGATVNGSIPQATGTDVYRISGTAGQRLFFEDLSTTSTTDSSSTWQLFGPGNQNVTSSYLFYAFANRNMEVTLPATGTYLLSVHGGAAAGPVPYSFRVTAPATNTAALVLGAQTSGNIATPGQHDAYTFNAVAGQRLFLDGQTSSITTLFATLTGPTGTQVFNGRPYQDNGPFTVTTSGTYTLTIGTGAGDNSTGTYNFRLLDLSNSPAITLGTVVSGTDNPGDGTVAYTLTGTAGKRLFIENLSAAGPAGSALICMCTIPLIGMSATFRW